ncbi:P-loop NTPase fold protein [Fibrobacter sp. UWB10]|uniref:KAP family P-loop NTPase fold protein n=1 Tax=Fibrobacter sp. UWB10 TaxID=1896201 RepID=UPI0024037446|nr:P-loop NTPase fold protein [Fibrobacter sp. UWB10]SMP55010.1 KAP family P-loop domain-containing protein [Fibrobacter sp. UWB10]
MQQDMLGREPFVTLLDNIITQKVSVHEGFSFAIDGKWGCGKSWILKELEQKLELKNYLVIHYNCWENEYYEEPLVAILSVIIDKLNQLQENIPDKNKKDRIQIALKFFAEIISTILTNKFGIGFNDFLESGKKAIAADKAPAISKDFDKNQSLKDALAAVRENLLQLTNVLSESKDVFENVIIVVDELDRCLPEYAIKVMQRLHHICFDTTSDKYMFIQLAAINKSELLGSIVKTFGREFNLKQKYTAADTKPGSIVYENFDECQIQFGNYYFKKFFQLIIPVSNGEKIERPLSLLDGFENNFDSTDVTGKECVEKFFTDVLAFFPMRIKLELVHLVKTAHEITSMDESLDKNLKYNTLCIELIDCLCKSVLKKNHPQILHKKDNDESRNYLFLRISNLKNIEGIFDINAFTIAFEKWSQSECGAMSYRTEHGTSTYHPFSLQRTESYIKAFYEPTQGLICKKIDAGPIPSEVAFIEAFRKTLDILV